MQFQSALSQPSRQRFPYGLRLCLASSVYQPIIRIPTPGQVGKPPRHPGIERIMHKEVGQDRADNAALRGAAASLDPSPPYSPQVRDSLADVA